MSAKKCIHWNYGRGAVPSACDDQVCNEDCPNYFVNSLPRVKDPLPPPDMKKPKDDLKTEVLKLSPGKDDTIVIKLDHQPNDEETDNIPGWIQSVMGSRTKVLVLGSGESIEMIPARNRHYGIWIPANDDGCKGAWIEHSNGELFTTGSIGVARAMFKRCVGDFPNKAVCEFNDDGTPGRVMLPCD